MFELLIVPLVPAVALAGGVLVLRRREAARWHSGLVSYRLRCPYGLKAEAVVRFVAGLSGLVAPRWQRVTAMRIVGFETTATHHGIAHHLVVARWLAPTVLAQLQAALPTVAAAEDPDYRLPPVTAACEFRLVGTHRPLAADVPVGIERLAASVLASLQPLQPGEQLVVQ
ncbi:MAG TPA: hypothetical protein VFA63_12540, partial [Pseudonocardiaceae bacterium]|nr:hypothetical protein [Pseudonocardiaceae bacterium]